MYNICLLIIYYIINNLYTLQNSATHLKKLKINKIKYHISVKWKISKKKLFVLVGKLGVGESGIL